MRRGKRRSEGAEGSDGARSEGSDDGAGVEGFEVGCEWAEEGEHQTGVAIGLWRGGNGVWDWGGDGLGLRLGSKWKVAQEIRSASSSMRRRCQME